MSRLSRRDAIAKAFRITKRGEDLEKRDPWSTLVSKKRWREFGDDLDAALAKEGYVIMPARNSDNVWPAIVNHMADAFFDAHGIARLRHGFYESFYAGYNAMIKVATSQNDTEKPKDNLVHQSQENAVGEDEIIAFIKELRWHSAECASDHHSQLSKAADLLERSLKQSLKP